MLKLTLLAGVIHLPVAAWMHSHFFGRPLADAAGSEAAGSTANDAASAGPFQIDQDVVYSGAWWL